MAEPETKTEAKPFDYLEVPHMGVNVATFMVRDPENPEYGKELAVAAWDPAAAELIRAGAEIVALLQECRSYLGGRNVLSRAQDILSWRHDTIAELDTILARLTRGAEDGAR
jgi:hypothetical protein